MGMLKAFLNACFAFAFIFVIWSLIDYVPFRTEVTVYHAFCNTNIINGNCNGVEETAGRTTYRANPDQQTVIYWSEGLSPSKFQNCTVRDSKNWVCTRTYDQGLNEDVSKMIDGVFSQGGTSDFYRIMILSRAKKWRDVSRWDWGFIWMTEHLRK